jgi:hypothetical protein
MKIDLSGNCLDLSLISLPDAAGTVQVHFISTLAGSAQEFNFTLNVVPANDPPVFRLNCSSDVRRLWGSGAPLPWATHTACKSACSDPKSLTGEGPCLDMSFWLDFITFMFNPGCRKYNEDPATCHNHISVQSINCGIVGKEACCVCGGGARNRPLIDSKECSITVTIIQLTPAERKGAEVEVPKSADSPYPYNSQISSQACVAAVEVRHAAIDMLPSPWPSATDEHNQSLTFWIHPVDPENIARFFSPLAQPSIDPKTGTLTLCLERGKTHGVVAFDVFIQDDGGVESSGINSYGPARLNVEILQVNQEPTFQLCCGSTVHAIQSSGLHVLPAFIVNISKGERDESGQDLETSQDVSFTVIVSQDMSEHIFVMPPRIHANGTLEFKLRDGVNGLGKVHVSVQDDGGTAHGGIDSSQNISFDIAVSGDYLEIVLSGIPPEGSEQQVMCDIATDLQISCESVVKTGPGIYHVSVGTTEAVLRVGERAAYVKSIGRGPLPRTLAGSVDSSRDRRLLESPQVDPNAPDGGQGWEAWMIPAGTEYLSVACTSSRRHEPSCEVQLADVPASSLLFLTIDVVHTDFAQENEFISSVTAGSRQIGQSLLVSGGSDEECNVSTRILDTIPIESSLLSQSGVLAVRVATSSSVGMFMCNGSTLVAKVSLMANALSVLSAKIIRSNLNQGAGSFELALSHLTMTGNESPGSNPLVLENFITNVVEPSETELDLRGRARLVFTVRPVRYKPHITASKWTHDGTDGGLLLGFQPHQSSNVSEQATAANPWYSCYQCINASSSIPGEDFTPIQLHRTALDGRAGARIVNLTLTLAQSLGTPNGLFLCILLASAAFPGLFCCALLEPILRCCSPKMCHVQRLGRSRSNMGGL